MRFFVISAGVLLLLTALAKLVSAAGSAKALGALDPVFLVPFRYVFLTVGLVEIGVAAICLFGKQMRNQALLLAWLSSCFLIYRLFLVYIGYAEPCHCMGTLTDALHIPPHTANLALEIVLGYLLLGSYATLFWLRKQSSGTPLPGAGGTKVEHGPA